MRDQVLFLLESAYPNILEIDDLAKYVLHRTVTLANEYVSGQNSICWLALQVQSLGLTDLIFCLVQTDWPAIVQLYTI